MDFLSGHALFISHKVVTFRVDEIALGVFTGFTNEKNRTAFFIA